MTTDRMERIDRRMEDEEEEETKKVKKPTVYRRVKAYSGYASKIS